MWSQKQRIREEATFEDIFAKASLTVWNGTPLTKLQKGDYPVKMWLLY